MVGLGFKLCTSDCCVYSCVLEVVVYEDVYWLVLCLKLCGHVWGVSYVVYLWLCVGERHVRKPGVCGPRSSGGPGVPV